MRNARKIRKDIEKYERDMKKWQFRTAHKQNANGFYSHVVTEADVR